MGVVEGVAVGGGGIGVSVGEPVDVAVGTTVGVAEGDEVAVAVGGTVVGVSVAVGVMVGVAVSVGVALVIGVLRIIVNWPLPRLIVGGYVLVILLTEIAPPEIIGIAYDSGGVTTSTVTVPLVTALGVGLASSLKGRNPMLDGFGLIAFASLTPILFVLVYGIVA